MCKAVFDTNVVISGMLWRGTPYTLLKAAAAGRVSLFTSIPLLEELEVTLSKPRLKKALSIDGYRPAEIRAMYEEFVKVVVPNKVAKVIVADDPTDDAVVTTALAADARYIVSGNGHLLELKHSFDLRIVTPARFLDIYRSAS